MISGVLARVRSFWRGLRRRAAVETEMVEEFRLHVDLRAQDLMRSGLTPAEALRRARGEFGNAERHKEEARAARGLHYFDGLRFSWLDFKLGFRMLARYPGLTVVGGLAMAFAVWVGAGTFELIGQWLHPRLPLPDGDRIVGIELRHVVTRGEESRALHDFVTWRDELESIEHISAFRTAERNLFVRDGRGEPVGEPVGIAEISASAFRAAGVRPLLGRFLIETDELAGASPVVVIGHDIWQTRFGGDPDVVGRAVRLGNVQSTVVGVMPKKFAFPVSHEAWTPLRLNVLNYARLHGPGLNVLGRLVRGVTLGEAQSELDYLGGRTAAEFPDTHEHLRPRVMAYAQSIFRLSESESAALPWVNLFAVMLVVLVCGNVSLLMLARAATRESEIVVRSALGASRGRIIMQLLAEALVLASVGAIIGLAATGPGLRSAMFLIEGNLGRGRLPFWIDDSVSQATMLYAAGLTVFGAVIAGVLPALRVTRGLGVRLRQATAGGGGLKFSGVWTVAIVAQVAVTVAFPVATLFLLRQDALIRSFDAGFAEQQYVSVRLELDSENASGIPADTSRAQFLARFRRTIEELERRLQPNPPSRA
ncbi:MAG: ABC transporter permease [Longimicrobiales bacterium]